MDIEQIRVRIMSEAYDLADRGDLEGYNSVKVMCSDVLQLINALVAAECEACAKVCDVLAVHPEYASDITKVAAQAIRARGEK
jgi:hypothetical protein